MNDSSSWTHLLPRLRCLSKRLRWKLDGATDETLRVGCRTLMVDALLRMPDATDDEYLSTWRGLRNALELFALVHLVDPNGSMHVLAELGSNWSNFDSPVVLEQHKPPTYQLQFYDNKPASLVERVVDLLISPSSDDDDHELDELKRSILARATGDDVRAAWTTTRIPLQLLHYTVTLSSETYARWYAQSNSQPGRFVFTGVDFYKFYGRILPPAVQSLHELVSMGVPIRDAEFENFACRADARRVETAQLVEDLLGTGGASQLVCRQLKDQQSIEALFSGFNQQSQLRTLDIGAFNQRYGSSRSERFCCQLWVLRSLFSPDEPGHSIESVTFLTGCDYFETDDLRLITERLHSHGALRTELMVAGAFKQYIDAQPPTHDVWVTLPPGYPIRVEPQDDWREHTLCFPHQAKCFRVLRDDPTRSFIDVLVSGYGRCWVERSKALVLDRLPVKKWRFDRHPIRTLQFTFVRINRNEQRTVETLLALVGKPVTTLRFCVWFPSARSDPEGLDIDFLAAIIRACGRIPWGSQNRSGHIFPYKNKV